MRKGTIVLIPFPFTDLSGQKVRPAVILHTGRSADCIVAFISSKKEKRLNFDIPIQPSTQNGLKADSRIKLDKIATLQKSIALGEIGVVDKKVMMRVDSTLKKIFELK